MAPDPEISLVHDKPDEIKGSRPLEQTPSEKTEQTETNHHSRTRSLWTRYGKHVVYAVIWLLFTG